MCVGGRGVSGKSLGIQRFCGGFFRAAARGAVTIQRRQVLAHVCLVGLERLTVIAQTRQAGTAQQDPRMGRSLLLGIDSVVCVDVGVGVCVRVFLVCVCYFKACNCVQMCYFCSCASAVLELSRVVLWAIWAGFGAGEIWILSLLVFGF